MQSAAVRTRPGIGLLPAARTISAGLTAGLLGGLLFGGLGGRVAMLILRLTSDPGLRGLETDDGFTIGVVSSATAFLVVFTAMLGALGGLLYLVVRSWLPVGARPWLFGALAGLVGGAEVIRPGGIDFTRLEPLGLAVAMFVALPAAYGVFASVVAERFLAPGSAFRESRGSVAGLAILLPIVLFGGIGVLIVVGVIAAILMRRHWPAVAAAWTSAPMTTVGRAVLVAVGIAGALALARDVAAVL
jgi:hypothetical protein